MYIATTDSYAAGSKTRLFINSNGNITMTNSVAIGFPVTTAPSYTLDVNGDTRVNNDIYITNVGTGSGLWADDGAGSTIFSIQRQTSNEIRVQGYGDMTFYTGSSTGTLRATISANGLQVNSGALGVNVAPSTTDGRIDASNDIIAYASDLRLKEKIEPIVDAIQKVKKLRGFTYNWNSLAKSVANFSMDERLVGVGAQDALAVLPEAVKLAPFDNNGMDVSISGENYLTVQYEKLVPLLIEAIKEQQVLVEKLEARIEKLEAKL
jgi:hypothetical protein